jgi:Zn-dependent protease
MLRARVRSRPFMFDQQWLLTRLAMWIPLVLSLTVHEWAHAMSAYRLGDDTAEREGRLTLNPLVHLDLVGTVLLPLIGIPFGWAKPVPVNPARFRRDVNMRTGMMWTAAAGPLSNIVLAFVCVLLLMLTVRFRPDLFSAALSEASLFEKSWVPLLRQAMGINLALAIFNAIPIPPLDGSRVVDGLMPLRHRAAWERFCGYGPLLLLGVMFLPQMVGFSLIGVPMQMAYSGMTQLAAWLVGL